MEPSEKLNITFAGVKMRSPLGVGPVAFPMIQSSELTPEAHAGLLYKHVEAGAGYVVTVCSYAAEDSRHLASGEHRTKFSPTRWMKVEGMDGLYFFDATIRGPLQSRIFAFDQRRKIVEILKKKLPEDVPIVNSQSAKDTPEANVVSAKKVEELGVDLIELQLQPCAYLLGAEGLMEAYLDKMERRFKILEEIVRATVKAVKIPVGVKLTPGEFGYPRFLELVKRFRGDGAKYVQLSNAGSVIAPPDIYNRGKPCYPYSDGNPFTGISGSPLRPECYRDVAAVAKFVPGVEIAASGGFMKPEHAIEVMMLGAGLAQFCTGLLFHGRKLLERATQFLDRFLDEQGYESVEELIGLGLHYVKSVDKINLVDAVAQVDQGKCTGCGICTNHFCLAMERKEDGNAQANTNLCFGCGLCVATCPSHAVMLVPREMIS